MNTRSFLYDLCVRTLEIDNSIKFVGVVNNDGKLITGKGKHIISRQNEYLDRNFLKHCLNPTFNKLSYSYDSLNSSIDNKNTIFYSKLFETSDFSLICVRDNTFIAFTSLTEGQDEYLCIYFKVFDSLNEILDKLNTIFEFDH